MKTIYKLGSLDPLIVPGQNAAEKLRTILKDNKEQFIICGPDIQVSYVAENIEELKIIAEYELAKATKYNNVYSDLDNYQVVGIKQLEDK